MKKVICMLVVLLLCLNLAVPAFAAEDNGFVPSITYKPNPELVPSDRGDGQETPGIIRDEEGSVIGYLGDGCLKITPIAYVWDETIEVEKVISDLLMFVYNGLNDGTMQIPYEDLDPSLSAENMVIRDLFDARWTCEEHPKMLEPKGVVVDLTFDLGVVPEAEIYVHTYNEETGEWEPIVKTVNNGDGTVTCTFEHLCAIAFSMPMAASAAPDADAATGSALPWIILLIIAAVAFVVVVVNRKKKSAV